MPMPAWRERQGIRQKAEWGSGGVAHRHGAAFGLTRTAMDRHEKNRTNSWQCRGLPTETEPETQS